MASRAPALVRSLRLWLSAVKLLGGFPYSWDEGGQEALCPNLRSCRGLRLWSYFMAGLQLVVVVGFKTYVYASSSVLSFADDTQGIMSNIISAVVAGASVVLYVHILLGGRRLRRLVSHMDACFPEGSIGDWTARRSKGLMLSILTHSTYSMIVVVTYVKWFVTTRKTQFHVLLNVCCDVFVYTIFLPVTYLSINLVCCFLERSLSDVALALESPPSPAARPANAPADRAKTTKILVGSDKAVDAGRVQAASRRVVQVHECQLLMCQHFSLPVLALMALSATWLITDVYRKITQPESQGTAIFLVYVTYNIVNLCVLCCSADLLKNKVSEREGGEGERG